MQKCGNCGLALKLRSRRYCTNRCQMDKQYKTYIAKWKLGLVDGNIGIRAKNTSGHLRRYLFDKYHGACSMCGWNMISPVTGTVPLEIDHIDGDADNSREDNLRLICPNCHSLTFSFRNLNKGKGRSWRREKYKKHTNISPP
jgi:hypothetical protein